MELVVRGLELYGRYVVTVLILSSSVALAAWLASSIVSWSNTREGKHRPGPGA